MKPTTHHYLAFSISAAVFCVSIAGYIFLYYSINNQVIKTTNAEATVTLQERMAIKQKNISNSLNTTANDRALIESFILSGKDTLKFIEQIEGLSAISGATVSLASISTDTLSFHGHINIQGSWSTSMKALHLIESLPYSLMIQNVRLTTQGKSGWMEDFDITLPMTTL